MFEPPNFSSTFDRPDAPCRVAASSDAQVAARAEHVDAIAVDRRRRARAVAAIVAEAPAVGHLPELLAGRGIEGDDVFRVLPRAPSVYSRPPATANDE